MVVMEMSVKMVIVMLNALRLCMRFGSKLYMLMRCYFIFLLKVRRRPRSTLFPKPSLCRSEGVYGGRRGAG